MSRDKIIVNNFVVAGEVLDIINYKEFNVGQMNECWGYTLRIETNPETGEYQDVEYFTMLSNEKTNKSMDTIYREVKTRAKDEVGDKVRCTGRVTSNDYYKNGELIRKIVLSGSFCNRDKGKASEKELYEPCSKFDVVGVVGDVTVVSEEEINITLLINEYKSKNGKIKGHEIEVIGRSKPAVDAMKDALKKDMIVPFGGLMTKNVTTEFLPEEETAPLSTEGAWGTGLEEIEKKNKIRAELRENGVKREKFELLLTGNKPIVTEEDIEDQKLPFEADDIDEMYADVDDRLEKAKDRDNFKNVSDDEVPF